MREIILFIVAIISFEIAVFAQSDIKLKTSYGAENSDLQSILYFDEIGYEKLTFTGKDLIGKDFLITLKEYTKGKLTKQEVVFDSKESEQFKITEDKFMFKVLTRITAQNTARIEFQFNGFRKMKEYKAVGRFNQFALKDFFAGKPEAEIPLNKSTYLLTYMMPFVNKQGWEEYCDVAQSGVNPEEFGIKYAIPQYFLFDIKFQ